MRGACFLAFVLFSLLACLVLVMSLADYGCTHLAPWAGLLSLALLLRGAFQLFYSES